jgi:hypothetical protein
MFMNLIISGTKRVEVRARYTLLGVAWTHHFTLSSPNSGWRSSTLPTNLPLFPSTLTFWFRHPYRDQICSLNFSLVNLYFIGCIYHSGFGPDWNQGCGTTRQHWPIQFVLAALPFFCRFVQSIRRWYDSGSRPHLINVSSSCLFDINIRLTPDS